MDEITRNTPWSVSQSMDRFNISCPIRDSKQFAVVKLVNGISVRFGNLFLCASIEAIYGTQKLNQKYYEITGTLDLPESFH
ncbi:hypothetical protein AB3N59_03120 [Leptospira sp. WS92.C1]